MSLKIFVSSVSTEFEEERKALNATINMLQSTFVGMEFFGSDPDRPAEYCVRLVKQSDLYLGLIGLEYGSEERTQHISYTQIEYNTAIAHNIPCLVYLSGKALDSNKKLRKSINEKQAAFIQELRKNHTIQGFFSSERLQTLFLADFLKLQNERRFPKLIFTQMDHPIPAELLHHITQEAISEQIKAVAQEKYIPELYTARQAEAKVEEFVKFESMLQVRVGMILERLVSAVHAYGLNPDVLAGLSQLQEAILESDAAGFSSVLEQVKKGFFFSEVEALFEQIDALILLPPEVNASTRFHELTANLERLPFIEKKAAALKLREIITELKARPDKRYFKTMLPYSSIQKLFPSFFDKKALLGEVTQLSNSLLLELASLMRKNLKRCVAFVDKAGTGKTNLACHTAATLVRDHPVILLSGQMDLSNEYDIETHIQKQLEFKLGGFFSDWINRISEPLGKKQQWLFIIIDGINENSNRPLMIRILKNFLPKTEHRRIKLVLTCRDLHWDIYKEVIQLYLFMNMVPLNAYSNVEWRHAVKLYFDKYRMKCVLGPDAELALKNPLLLRFFCEAYQDQELGSIANIKLVNVFDHYLDRISFAIGERTDMPSGNPIVNFLIQVAGCMWDVKSVTIEYDRLVAAATLNDQLYKSILSENIILEEQAHQYSTRRKIRFLYDEFMEYMLARFFFEKIHDVDDPQKATDEAVQELAGAIPVFPAAFGAVLFLDQILQQKGTLINSLIKICFRSGIVLQPIQLIYAFDRISLDGLDEEIIGILDTVYGQVPDEHKNSMAQVILNILPRIPNDPFAQRYVDDVLELSFSETVKQETGYQKKKSAEYRSGKKKEDEKELLRLPPARYHYSDTSRLSAIGLLVQQKDGDNLELIHTAIERIGRSDMHNALKAMMHLDCMDDARLFVMLEKYIDMERAEYRVFVAWLLRYRYGKQPALFLNRLLTDKESRVHEFTFALFETRNIETELAENILSSFRSVDGVWHLQHFVRLLAKRERFMFEAGKEILEKQIAHFLEELSTHAKPSLRLEVFRTSLQYPEYFNKDTLRQRILLDESQYIRSQVVIML